MNTSLSRIWSKFTFDSQLEFFYVKNLRINNWRYRNVLCITSDSGEGLNIDVHIEISTLVDTSGDSTDLNAEPSRFIEEIFLKPSIELNMASAQVWIAGTRSASCPISKHSEPELICTCICISSIPLCVILPAAPQLLLFITKKWEIEQSEDYSDFYEGGNSVGNSVGLEIVQVEQI